MSPASSKFAIDFAIILLHLQSRVASPMADLSAGQPLANQTVAFTGKLSSLGRKEARALVARLGGAAAEEVNAKTTMLVIGAESTGPDAKNGAIKSNKL